MKQEKQDRRSLRTRRLITSAMMELLFERRYEEFTVQDVLDRAQIGRSTFYSHYFDKEDVLANIAEQQIAHLSEQFAPSSTAPERISTLGLFQHVYEKQRYFKALLRGHARDVLWDAAQSSLSAHFERRLNAAPASQQPSATPIAIAALYLAGALLNLIKWWLDTDMPYRPEQMDVYFQQLAFPASWATLDMA